MSLNDPSEQREMLESVWGQLAAFAWQHYKQLGRGCVVILQNEIEITPVSAIMNRLHGPMSYSTEAAAPGKELPPSVDEMVRFYDPRKAIVVLFVTDNMDFDGHHIERPKGELSPPKAYAASAGK
jgi:hypothetical protein